MAWYKIKNNTTNEIQVVSSLDGYDLEEWTSEEVTEPTEKDSIYNAIDDDVVKAEAYTIEKIEEDADKACMTDVKRARRQLAIDRTWHEIQRLKLASATNQIPPDALGKAKMFPTLMAVANVTGNSLAQVATALEDRLWDRVRRMALAEAKLLKAHDDIRSATTAADKLAIVESVLWGE